MLMAVFVLAASAAAASAWANYWLIMTSGQFTKTPVFSRAICISALELAVFVLCLACWIFLGPLIAELLDRYMHLPLLATSTQFSAACLTFVIITPPVSMFLFAGMGRNASTAGGKTTGMSRAYKLGLISATIFAGIFLIFSGLALAPLYVLFGGRGDLDLAMPR
jgi:hypothetical protein